MAPHASMSVIAVNTSLNCDSFYLKKNPHIPITRYYKSNRTIKVLLAQEIN